MLLGGIAQRTSGSPLQGNTRNGLIIQVNVGYFDPCICVNGRPIDHEAMILRSDFCFSRDQIFDGMIHSAVAIEHLDRLQSLAQRQNLMPQTNAEESAYPKRPMP